MGSWATAGDDLLYRLESCFLSARSDAVWALAQDVPLLLGLAAILDAGSSRRAEILVALTRCLDAIDVHDIEATADVARACLADALAQPAHASAHHIVATGHAHIDTAWLWPVRETVRKCARTFSNVLALMDEDPTLVFACSSAQQFVWVKQHYPELFARLAERVEEGRFVPVGGMWVESDTNMPSGESMIRQFLYGKRFFLEEFGVEPHEVWLPDSFGYSAALPQIADHVGCHYLLTQKLSWNDTNVMPFSSFLWEGIDGTRLFTHFPPVSTYNSDLSPAELHRSEVRFQERGRARLSLVPFGYGDGGGGPTREMVGIAHRAASLEGIPEVEIAAPSVFFARAAEEMIAPPVWTGELYLEKHRGTYTSQARIKRGNRRCESLLHEAELWAATALVRHGSDYPHDDLALAWHTVLLNQFHDILPGSSIAWVNEEAAKQYDDLAARLETIIATSLAALAGSGEDILIANASPLALDADDVPLGIATANDAADRVTVDIHDHGATMSSGYLELGTDEAGRFVSLVDTLNDRQLIPAGLVGNDLQLFADLPAQWDAWDIDEDYRRARVDLSGAPTMTLLDDRAGVRVTRTLGESEVTQDIRLEPNRAVVEITTSVDWRERQRMLKLAFPLCIHTSTADSETQFGFVTRSILANTSWDSARFETCAHRWVRVSEPGYEVGIANATSYGHDIIRTPASDGSTSTVVRQSLLRSSTFPDPGADAGRHVFRTTIRAAAAGMAAAAEGYAVNLPPRRIRGGTAVAPLARTTNEQIVIETIKAAEDRSGDIIVRLYEAAGSHARGRVILDGLSVVSAVDGLERLVGATWMKTETSHRVLLTLRPFQLVTLRATPVRDSHHAPVREA
jgi:alpha-mannosidase